MRSLTARGLAATAAVVAALVTLQVSLFGRAKEALFDDASVRAKAVGLPAALSVMRRSLAAPDVAAIAVLVLVAAAAVVAEARTRAVRRWFAETLDDRRASIVLLVLLAFATQRWLLDDGPLLRHDASSHTGLAALAAENLRAGEAPFWSFRWYGGFPLLRAYGPGFHFAAAAAAVALGSIEWGVKCVLLAAGVGTAAAVARLARRVGCARGPAIVAGLAAVLSFQRTHAIAWSGKFPEALLYLLFPLLLAESWDIAVARPGAARRIAGFGGVAGAMGLVHLGLAPFGWLLASVFGGVVALRTGGPRNAGRSVLLMAAGGVIAGAIVLPLALGVLGESGWMLLGRGGFQSGGISRYGLPAASVLHDLAVWRMGWTGDVHAYLGLSLIALGIGGIALGVRRSNPAALAVAVAAALCLPLLGGGYLPSRCAPFLVVLLATGAAIGLASLRAPRGNSPAAALVALCALCADLAPTTFQAPGAAGWDASHAHLVALADGARGGRCLRLTRRGDDVGLNDAENVVDVPADVPLGSAPYLAPNAWCAFTYAVVNDARNALAHGGGLRPEDVRALGFQGVAVVGEDGRTRFGAPQEPWTAQAFGAPAAPDAPWIAVPGASPVTFGKSVVAAEPGVVADIASATFSLYEKEWRAADTPVRAAARDAVRAMGLDPSRPTAERLLACDEDSARVLAAAAPGPADGHVSLAESGPAFWRTEVEMTHAGVVRLAVAWSPRIRVTCDGAEPATPPRPDATGGVLVALAAGRHVVEVRAQPSPLVPLWWLALAVLAAAFVVRIRSRPSA